MFLDGRIQVLAPFKVRWQLGEKTLQFHRKQVGVRSPKCCWQQRFMSNTDGISQAQRACVMQPRVRRTLGIESAYVFISPNPNGVPSKVDRSQAFPMFSNSRGMDATPLGLVVGIACGASHYPGLFQPWATIRKPVGLERKDADHAPASLRPRLASIKPRNCSIVSARDGSRSKRFHRASNLRFSASLTSRESSSVSMGVGRCMPAASSFLSPSQPRSHSLFAS